MSFCIDEAIATFCFEHFLRLVRYRAFRVKMTCTDIRSNLRIAKNAVSHRHRQSNFSFKSGSTTLLLTIILKVD